MEKLYEVIRAITCCRVNEDEPCAGNCPYDGMEDCVGAVMVDALDLLKEYEAKMAERGSDTHADN